MSVNGVSSPNPTYAANVDSASAHERKAALASAAFDAIKKHDQEKLNELLSDPDFDIMATNEKGRSLLHWSVKHDNPDAVDAVISAAEQRGKRFELTAMVDHAGKTAMDRVTEMNATNTKARIRLSIGIAQTTDPARTREDRYREIMEDAFSKASAAKIAITKI